MAGIDIDPFGEHESRPEEPNDENIPLDSVTPVGGGGSTWDPRGSQALRLWGAPCLRAHGNRNASKTHHLEVYVIQVYFTKNT